MLTFYRSHTIEQTKLIEDHVLANHSINPVGGLHFVKDTHFDIINLHGMSDELGAFITFKAFI